jgi:AraC-like DNA-binding protein
MQPEVYTRYILPHPLLLPYVRCFAVRKFDTGDCEFPKAMIADHEMTMAFFLHSKLFEFTAFDKDIIPYTVNKNGYAECCFAGLQTSTKGFLVFKGLTTLLNIHFKPTGFFYIFNISPKELVDKMDDTKSILSNEILLLHEQMHESNNISDCVVLLENFLIKKLISQKPHYKHTGISDACDFLINKKGMYCVKQLASDYNTTVQTLEVQFTEQVGIDPKYFCRVLRFNTAVNTKLYNPNKSWTDVAYSCGYYDQAHLIKDFKEFTLLSPRNFMITIHPPFENFE